MQTSKWLWLIGIVASIGVFWVCFVQNVCIANGAVAHCFLGKWGGWGMRFVGGCKKKYIKVLILIRL